MICSPVLSSSSASFPSLPKILRISRVSALTGSSTFHVPRHRQHIAQVEVEVVFSEAGRRPVRAGPNARQGLTRNQAEPLDRAPIVQVGIANPVDVGGGPPGMRSRVLGKTVGRRSIAAIRRDMNPRPDCIPKPLQAHCQERYSARNVPGESPQWRSLTYVDL